MVEKMESTSKELGATIRKLRELDAEFASFISMLEKLVSRMVSNLTGVVDTLKVSKVNLSRSSRELYHFFMPSGLRALLLRPSDLLILTTESVAALCEHLSELEIKAKSALKILKEGTLSTR